MPLVLKDRVKETTTTTGTGTITLLGASTGYQSFSVIGNGNTCYYAIVGSTEWEVGIGTYTSSGTTLSRDTVLESSNAGSKVDFAAGTKDVFVTYPAELAVMTDALQTLTNKTLTDPTLDSDLIFTGTGNRITGDFSSTTLANRVAFQSSTANGFTEVLAIPNGTSTTAAFNCINSSGATNFSFGQIAVRSTDVRLTSGITGTGTYLPMTFYTNGLEQVRISTDGAIGLGGTNYGTASTQAIVSNGSAAAPTWQTVVTPSATQTLTNKTLTDPAIIGCISEDVYTETTASATLTIDPSNGSIQQITLGQSASSVSLTNFVAGEGITVMIADGTAFTITWGTSVTWVGGSAPTLATTGFTVTEFWKVGSIVYGARVGDVA